ncbi:uncharacterized protein LOC126463402 [Schistocerca serialis cubense]|uniref:uncharacterized protein LOC126463402 n=1 Tax=Schistocerca serialis cubense TaxID=2023355 RepID=UPI00214E0D3F|nr:uncharacterized protein LOC126463402 [Schistocerca serialis cubense]
MQNLYFTGANTRGETGVRELPSTSCAEQSNSLSDAPLKFFIPPQNECADSIIGQLKMRVTTNLLGDPWSAPDVELFAAGSLDCGNRTPGCLLYLQSGLAVRVDATAPRGRPEGTRMGADRSIARITCEPQPQGLRQQRQAGTNRETMVEIGDSVRGKDIYILQTGTKDVNNNIMELLIMAYACKTSSAKSIVGVIPYLPYSKQCKMRKRGCIVSKLLAKMMCKSGLSHVITMDLHKKEIQEFFDCPVDNLRASPFLLQYIQECIPDYRNAVIVARNPGSAKKATSYAERLRLGIAVIHGEQEEASTRYHRTTETSQVQNDVETIALSRK